VHVVGPFEDVGSVIALEEDVAASEGDAAVLEGDAAVLEGDAAVLEGDAAVLEGEAAGEVTVAAEPPQPARAAVTPASAVAYRPIFTTPDIMRSARARGQCE
jgi:hypothetical protein